MKITLDQLAALQLQQKNAARTTKGEGFSRILDQEMNQPVPAHPGVATPLAMPMVGLDHVLRSSMPDTVAEQSVMGKVDTLLSTWEDYSQVIGMADGNLRQGFQLLTEIRQGILELKTRLAENPTIGSEIRAMVEELDILAATEEFKFNRGDYLH